MTNPLIGYTGVFIAIPENIRAFLSARGEKCGSMSFYADRSEYESLAAATATASAVVYCGHFSDERLSNLREWANLKYFGSIVLIGSDWKTNEVVAAIKLGFSDVIELPEDPSKAADSIFLSIQENANNHRDTTRATIPNELLERLSVEQATILELILVGKTTKQIGAILDLSVRTIHYRKKELFLQLGVRDKREAIEYVRLAAKRTFLAPTESSIRRYDESCSPSAHRPKTADSQNETTISSPMLANLSYIPGQAESSVL